MEHIYQYAWIIPFIPLTVPLLLGISILLFPTTTKKLRRMWAFPSISVLSIVMIFSTKLSIDQINTSSIYQYVWSWTINNDFSLEFGYLIDPLTSIMSMLITTVGILVFIYSDNYMSHDEGYLRFFAYLNFFNTSMLCLVTSSNFIQIFICWELVGICSYLLIGFWFTRPSASNACQNAFVTNRVGDFGLLLGILGLYWLTGTFEFRDLFEIFTTSISNNEVYFLFGILCTFFLFAGAIAKSAQFPLHVWLPDAMEGPTPISALIHAATMVAAGIFLVARLFPLLIVIPSIMKFIALIGIITVLLGASLALAQTDIKRGLAYSTMSQLGYIMLALGMGSYRVAFFHLITHAYSKALLFLGSGSIIHSMETIVGYSPYKSQNMGFMGGLSKHVPITKTSFLIGTLSLCGIPPFACFWSKDEIINDSWLYSPLFGIIACSVAGLTAFYMFRIYLLTFEGHLSLHFQKYSGEKGIYFNSISLWGGKRLKPINSNLSLITLLPIKKKIKIKDTHENVRKKIGSFISIKSFDNQTKLPYPRESEKTMLFSLLVLIFLTLSIGFIGFPLNQEGLFFDFLSKWLIPSINLFHPHFDDINYVDWVEFVANATFSVSIASFGIVIASFLYKPVYSSLQNFDFVNFIDKRDSKRVFSDKIQNLIYDWSYYRGYIDAFFARYLIRSIRGLSELVSFFDKRIIDGIPNGFGLTSFFIGESMKYGSGGRISSYLFLYLFSVSIFLFIFTFIYSFTNMNLTYQ